MKNPKKIPIKLMLSEAQYWAFNRLCSQYGTKETCLDALMRSPPTLEDRIKDLENRIDYLESKLR